ncbi:hypothetical protein ACHAXA_009772 [Cyclostephanos tholiformis]|uniref:Uncharacterized protein n=1 Tax=Cyclostephanos tholiformis TaxID=382380 RepID=A0ABD3SGH3_9STRA
MIITPPNMSPLGPLAFSHSGMQPNRQQHHHRSMHLVKRSRTHDQERPPPTTSAAIPLPKSHVHRTRSELQLADDVQRAEFEDTRMCVRLVVGMQSQCIKSGYVHPLTKQSLQEILRTKAANDHEIERKLREHNQRDAATAEATKDDDDEWGVNYYKKAGANASVLHYENSDVTPRPYHPVGMSPESVSALVKIPSDGSMRTNSSSEGYPEDDDCVFNLEL